MIIKNTSYFGSSYGAWYWQVMQMVLRKKRAERIVVTAAKIIKM